MVEEQVKLGEKDSYVKEMQHQLKKDHHIIAQLYKENMELERKLTEKTLEAQTPQRKESTMKEISKGRKIMQGHNTTVAAKPTSPLRRSLLDYLEEG
jgi:predicted nuclease of restriction endonuclease-like (RecB) superfamily